MIVQLELEVQQLLANAEQADATPLQDGLTIPEEITRRQERKAALAQARAHARSLAQQVARLSDDGGRSSRVVVRIFRESRSGCRNRQSRAAHRTSIWLRVKAAIGRVFIFRLAKLAHEKR